MKGLFTALITPFQASGTGIDKTILTQLIERQVEAKIDAIIFGGSTGEGQTLTPSELEEIFSVAQSFRGKIKILGACGSHGTSQTIDQIRRLENLGVEGVLVSTPSYNKPPQRGLVEHFKRVAAATKLPLVIYNIPGRSSVNIAPSTLLELWKIPNAVAVKESSGNMEQIHQVAKELPPGKILLSGDDPLNLPIWAIGGQGTVSVASNVAPKILHHIWTCWKEGREAEAREWDSRLQQYIPHLFTESNPIPAKWAVGQVLKTDLKLRLPLVSLDPVLTQSHMEALRAIRKLEENL